MIESFEDKMVEAIKCLLDFVQIVQINARPGFGQTFIAKKLEEKNPEIKILFITDRHPTLKCKNSFLYLPNKELVQEIEISLKTSENIVIFSHYEIILEELNFSIKLNGPKTHKEIIKIKFCDDEGLGCE